MPRRAPRRNVIEALLGEYRIVVEELERHLGDVTPRELVAIADGGTRDQDCVSIQSVLTHVVHCGRKYLTMIDRHRGRARSPWPVRVRCSSVSEYGEALDRMMADTMAFFLIRITQLLHAGSSAAVAIPARRDRRTTVG